jgi:hypothetical protein
MEQVTIPPEKDFNFNAFIIDKTYQELEEILKIKFKEDCDCLGEYGYMCVETSGFYYLIEHRFNYQDSGCDVKLQTSNPYKRKSCRTFLIQTGLDLGDIKWISPFFLEENP